MCEPVTFSNNKARLFSAGPLEDAVGDFGDLQLGGKRVWIRAANCHFFEEMDKIAEVFEGHASIIPIMSENCAFLFRQDAQFSPVGILSIEMSAGKVGLNSIIL